MKFIFAVVVALLFSIELGQAALVRRLVRAETPRLGSFSTSSQEQLSRLHSEPQVPNLSRWSANDTLRAIPHTTLQLSPEKQFLHLGANPEAYITIARTNYTTRRDDEPHTPIPGTCPYPIVSSMWSDMWYGAYEESRFLAMPLIFRKSLIQDARSEIKHLVEDMQVSGIPHRNFLLDANTWNPDNEAMIFPEQELGDLSVSGNQKADLSSYVKDGGTLVICGSAYNTNEPQSLNFLNNLFGFTLQMAARSTKCSMTKKEPDCDIFCSAPDSIEC